MCVEEQDILGTAAAIQKFLGLIPDEQMRQDLEKELQKQSTSKERWEAVLRHFREIRDKVYGIQFLILILNELFIKINLIYKCSGIFFYTAVLFLFF